MESTVIDGPEDHRHHSHIVELVASSNNEPSDSASEDQITPLLSQSSDINNNIKPPPKINIFTVSYPRRKANKEQIARLVEAEISPFTLFVMWLWSGSARYSGLLCMVLSASIYCVMEVIMDVASAQAIPLFEIAFTRCVVISILSFMWLRRSGEPLFGPANVRNLLVSRALSGCVSLLTFIYCIQRLPMSQAMILSFTTPIMASVAARFILHENLKIADIAGIAISFFGVLFILGSPTSIEGTEVRVSAAKGSGVHGAGHVFAVLIGLVSSLAGGVSYCLVRAGAKASDQPVGTIFSFGLLATPATAVCMIITEDFVLPSFYSFILMIFLSMLAFFAELFLARGLQLEKTSKVANIQYLEVALFQLWGMGSLRVVLSFGKLVGCFLILVSACCTVYFGPEKEIE